jgi:preprotein translocase subunit YajC
VNGLFIIILLFGLLYFVLIRPQQARQRQQQRLLNDVAVGDEILTVGGIYGIVQEIEPDEEGGDLVVEIAEGIHVRVTRKAVATVVKPDEEDDQEDEDDGEAEEADEHGDEPAAALEAAPGDAGAVQVEEVNVEQETVNPDAAGAPSPSERS